MIQFRTVCLSAHLDSFCRKLDELRGIEFVYEFEDPGEMRRRVGWRMDAEYRNGPITPENTERAKSCELLYDMLREFDLFEVRAQKGLKTVYAGERWLKPIPLASFKLFGHSVLIRLPGVVRLLVPRYRKMARRFVKLMDDANFYVFPIGVPAVRDMVRIYRVLKGDWRAFFREPKVEIERKLGGSVEGFPRMKLWGYFVEPSRPGEEEVKAKGAIERSEIAEGLREQRMLRILWVGGMIDWKRVDTLIRAFRRVAKKRSAALLIVGEGSERQYLEQLAGSLAEIQQSNGEQLPTWVPGRIVFHDYIKNDQVRELMRQASVYVMPSNAEEGWGAALSDALTEGCPTLSTYEAGSSATLLPEANLFHAGDDKRLAELFLQPIKMIEYSDKDWGGKVAAERLLQIVEESRCNKEALCG